MGDAVDTAIGSTGGRANDLNFQERDMKHGGCEIRGEDRERNTANTDASDPDVNLNVIVNATVNLNPNASPQANLSEAGADSAKAKSKGESKSDGYSGAGEDENHSHPSTHDRNEGGGTSGREPQATREPERLVNASSNVSNWDPANAKVFDVYMDNGSSQTSQLLDIFSCGNGKKESSTTSLKKLASEDDLELYNSGTGKRSHAFLDKLNTKKFKIGAHTTNERKQLNSLTLPMVKLEPQPQSLPPQLPFCLPNGLPHSAPIQGEQLTTFGQTDKWPSKMENAFVAALRLIIKNGTSKFKILEKNYGRNELISLFVQYHTGEIRTKKQISSHIQVWKKSISNKISSNFKVNSLDEEILQLIEDGAPQTNESIKLFYSCFEEIVSALSKQPQSVQTRASLTRESMPHYSYLVSPAQSATNPMVPFSHSDQQSQPQQQQQHQQVSQPATPLDYAKSIYGSLKTYKCVPVKVQDQAVIRQEIPQTQAAQQPPQPSQSQQPLHVYINPSQKNDSVANPILQSAKDLEYQQRQLIENLSNTQNQFKLPSVSQNLYVRNLQPPPMQTQQNVYTPSQPVVSGPMPHYPVAYNQLQHNGDQVPAGLVLPPNKYYQQPQIYVPVSAPPGPGNSVNSGFQGNYLPIKDSQQSQQHHPSSGSFSTSPSNQTVNSRGREPYQLSGNKQ